ncbi:carbohydrate ABC transporter permease [Paenibacillus cremeus]|uniref:Sugar ABC transporter permease n=1 Tax=Paenibacillus cremeus TaxID=2163881 RepID=A0A559KD23_9BACL|nr:sugar ABC transporter permease [Paenibacillus cremeus]TVY10031.1 sugar ABC transporter permease [Paenibacillus cremeus]
MEKRLLAVRMRNNVQAWLLLLPTFIFLALFTFYPLYKTVVTSFYLKKLAIRVPQFVGGGNYQKLWEDAKFWKVLGNTVIFVIGTVPAAMAIAMIMALFVNRAIRGGGLMRTFYFYPTVIPAVAIANIWLFIYTPKYGILNSILEWFHLPSVNWLGDMSTVLGSTIVMAIWKEAGFLMVFYLAGLQNIPKDLYEAADVDGARPWFVFWKVTFPLLMPSTLFIFIIATTGTFKLIDHLPVMTGGGPDNASNLLLYHIYETAFKFWDEGMAATLTVVLIVLLLIVSCIQFFGLDKKIHYS